MKMRNANHTPSVGRALDVIGLLAGSENPMSLAEILAKLSIPRQSLIRAFAGLQDIPDKVDLVVSAVPASKTMDIVKDCADIGVNQA